MGTVEIVKTFARPKIMPALQASRGLNVRKSAGLKGMTLLIRVLVKALSSYPKLPKSTFHLSQNAGEPNYSVPILMRISLFIKTVLPDQIIPKG